jgi:glycosyltransferase involved in cell wall biosynthesis
VTRIVFDSQIFALQQFGGISRYICALAEQLADQPGVNVRILAPLFINQYLKELKARREEMVRGVYLPPLPKLGQWVANASNLLFSFTAHGTQPHIVHETYYSATPTYRGNAARILTVYDLIHEKFPQSFLPNDPVARQRARAIDRADHIICISESTRRDLIEIYRVPEAKVSVTYLGYDALSASGLVAANLVGPTPYLLYVGSRHGYKNFDGLIKAYASSAALQAAVRIVCFGGGALTVAERTLLAQHKLSHDAVLQIGGGDERLAALYQGASAFVYPSRYEGFGIPPLEAMSLGCPVVCSNTSSIPEVVGNAGEYFDPNDTDSMRHAFESVLQSPVRGQELVALGGARVHAFSWARCATETLAIYRKLVA